MLRQYNINRYYKSLHGLISYSCSTHLRTKLFYSSKKTVKGYETASEHMHERKTPLTPQQEFAEIWEATTEDKISHLTREVRKVSGGKKTAIMGSVSAIVMGKMAWYSFQFLGMPQEMEVVMVFLPFTFLTVHWISWYFKTNAIYKQINLELPPNWTKNEGLIGGSNPEYHKLINMNDKSNLALLDQWTKEMNKHKIMCAAMCAANMTIIMLTGAMNPFGDPAIDALDPLMVAGYSVYPVIAYAFSSVVYMSPMKNVPLWKEEIVEDLALEDEYEDDIEDDEDSEQQ